VIWARRRRERFPDQSEPPEAPFGDLLEDAPVAALLLDADHRVVAANRAAAAFFQFDRGRLPAGLVEVTRESNLLDALVAQGRDRELRLAHRRRLVVTRLVAGRTAGRAVLFVTDLTDLRLLQRVRQEFVANLSHELRTPLTSLRLAVEGLAGEPPPATRTRFAGQALREADHLAAIVENLGQLAALDAGETGVRATTFRVVDVVEEAAATQRLERPVTRQVPEDLHVSADRSKLAQAIANLLDNADKFSPAGTPIEVAAWSEGDELLVTVRDHGAGISPEHWPRVFERFYKVDRSRTRHVAGTGLGLAIVKHLVQLQGGRVWTEAAAGGGQVFGIAVPARAPLPAVNPGLT
jgi:two-component system phosphate regulon sensor histidine kinase PhoR